MTVLSLAVVGLLGLGAYASGKLISFEQALPVAQSVGSADEVGNEYSGYWKSYRDNVKNVIDDMGNNFEISKLEEISNTNVDDKYRISLHNRFTTGAKIATKYKLDGKEINLTAYTAGGKRFIRPAELFDKMGYKVAVTPKMYVTPELYRVHSTSLGVNGLTIYEGSKTLNGDRLGIENELDEEINVYVTGIGVGFVQGMKNVDGFMLKRDVFVEERGFFDALRDMYDSEFGIKAQGLYIKFDSKYNNAENAYFLTKHVKTVKKGE